MSETHDMKLSLSEQENVVQQALDLMYGNNRATINPQSAREHLLHNAGNILVDVAQMHLAREVLMFLTADTFNQCVARLFRENNSLKTRLWNLAMLKHNRVAQWLLGHAVCWGAYDVSEPDKLRITLFKRSASQEFLRALHDLAQMQLLEGRVDQGQESILASALLGDATAQLEMAHMSTDEESTLWFTRAAEQGCRVAECFVGSHLYDTGHQSVGYQWIMRSAFRGYAEAYGNFLNRFGDFFPETAEKWRKKFALLYDAPAEVVLDLGFDQETEQDIRADRVQRKEHETDIFEDFMLKCEDTDYTG